MPVLNRIADRAEEIAAPEARQSRREPDDAVGLAATGKRNRAMGSGGREIGGEGEAPLDQRQPFAKILRRPGEEEVRACVAAGARPGAIEASIDERAIENPRRRRRRHGPSLMLQTGPRANLRFALTLTDGRPSGA